MIQSKTYKTLLLTLLSLVLSACGATAQSDDRPTYDNIDIEEYDSLIIYRPRFCTIEMAYGSEVPQGDNILFCCPAAFTAECLKYFTHTNIRCNHVNNGTFYAGSPEPVCNGVFTFYDEQGHFDRINDSSLQVAAEHNGMGFCQVLAIFDGEIAYTDTLKQDFWIHKDYVFRALCEKDGKLCLIESCDKVSYARFVRYLKEYGVKYAINLDMGGWSHSWYRDNYGDVITTGSSPTKYASNWLLFKP